MRFYTLWARSCHSQTISVGLKQVLNNFYESWDDS